MADALADLHRKFWNQGVARVLLVVDPKTAYLFRPATSGTKRPVESFLTAPRRLAAHQELRPCGLFSAEAITESVRTGEFYRIYSDKFKPAFAVDQSLAENLLALRGCLARPGFPTLPNHIAHDFICRLLFVCYLGDRGIVPLDGYPGMRLHEALASGADAGQARDFLYDLFKKLQYQFNGSMSDAEMDAEMEHLTPAWIDAVRNFLQGDAPNTRQPSFGFWAYDFNTNLR